ncbi:MAG: dihydrodipicolinate synthase family protein [Sphaerochaetaceae bacterium]|nr:dihydrodipicolinate synthase family protein [Sphaerochaetaceae bacterium]
MQKIKGITVPIVTPFDQNDNVDLEATAKLVDYLIGKGVHGLYPCGTTGEVLKMTIEERMLFVEKVVQSASGRCPVFVQVGAPTTKDAIKLAQHAYKIGAAGIGAVTPQYNGVNDREMEEYYAAIANSVPSDFPVYLYTIPQCAANDIKVEVAQKLVKRCPNIVGIKYSWCDFDRIRNLMQIENFDFIIGPDRFLLQALAMGAVGCVAGCAQACPEPFIEAYESFVSGNLEKAREAALKATELCDIVTNCANLAYVKTALRLNGVIDSHMRAPALDLTQAETEAFEAKFKAYKAKYNY